MATKLQRLLINRKDQQKKSDRFYVSFYGINDNVGNYLGTQVKSVTRPDVDINSISHQRRGAEFQDTGLLRFSDVSITFTDDEESVTNMLLYAQLMRQKKKYKGELDYVFVGDSRETYKFSIQIEMHNSLGDVTEGYKLTGCFIKSITHSQQIYATDDANDITVTLAYDNIEVLIFDQYLELST